MATNTQQFTPTEHVEQRRHERQPATENVTLIRQGAARMTGKGAILEASEGGFRVHSMVPLDADDFVSVLRGGQCIATRVIWVKEMRDGVEAGLAISMGRASVRRVRQTSVA